MLDQDCDVIVYGCIGGSYGTGRYKRPDPVWYVLTPDEQRENTHCFWAHRADFIVTSEGIILKNRDGDRNIGCPAAREFMEKALQTYKLLGK